MALKISTGIKPRAQKVVIYGAEGIGKTTLASQFPDPLFIDTEGGSSHLDVARIEGITNWSQLIDTVREVAVTPEVCRTLVIDTADWAEAKAADHICAKAKKGGIEDFGYGKGYTYLCEEFQTLLNACDKVIDAGIHVVLTAHAKMRKFEQPDEMGAYDRWEMKLSKQVAPLVKEWADMLLFCNYKTVVITTDTGSRKAQGGERVVYTSHSPVWDAKNRHGLPEEVPMEYAAIKDAVEIKTPQEKLAERIDADKVDIGKLMDLISEKGYHKDATSIEEYPDSFVQGFILAHWDKIIASINK